VGVFFICVVKLVVLFTPEDIIQSASKLDLSADPKTFFSGNVSGSQISPLL